MPSYWEELDIDQATKTWLIAEADQMQQGAKAAVNEATDRARDNRAKGTEIPAPVMALYLMVEYVEAAEEANLSGENMLFDMCLKLVTAVYRIVDKDEPEEEMPEL